MTGRFARFVAVQPDALAIASGLTRWTYAALDDAIAALAERLREHGSADQAVALVLPHGAPTAIGVLATARLGRPAVIVEPRMPEARREAVIADSGAAAVVTLADGDAAVPPTITPRDRGTGKRLAHAAIQPPDRPALVLYTSGSTGTPNGVVYSEQSSAEQSRRVSENVPDASAERSRATAGQRSMARRRRPAIVASSACAASDVSRRPG